MTAHTLIKNARLVSEGRIRPADVLIRAGRIARCDDAISAPKGCAVIDARGCFLLPGMIDDQVHFREPGLTHKADIATESRAAVAGGITSFMDMPNTRPPTVTLDLLEAKYHLAEQVSLANFAFYLGATNDNLEVIRSLPPGVAAGVKVFMGASTGNMLVDDEATLAGIFRDCRVLIATHCESTPRIEENLRRAMERYGSQIPVTEHPVIRDAEVCYRSSRVAIDLARQFGARLHILHLSTEREMELFQPGPIENKDVTAEVCVHHLTFCSDDYAALGNRIKCNPAIKSAADRDALRRALKDGRLDIIATDHAPHTREEKASTDYLSAPAGLPLVQDALLAALELCHDGVLELPELVRKVAHNPAIRYGVLNRGYVREDYFADLVLVDLEAQTEVTSERVLSKCGWSPFEGRVFRSRILKTWVNGALAFNGKRVVEHSAAMRIAFKST